MIAWATPAPARYADRFTRDIARWAAKRQLAPIAVASFSLGFAIIAAAWLTELSARDQAIGLVALIASVIAGRVARLMDSSKVTAATAWGQAACALLAELVIYAGLAGGVSRDGGTGLGGPVGQYLRGGLVERLGGADVAGVWVLAVTAAVVLALGQVADLCAGGPPAAPAREPQTLLPRRGLGSARLVVGGLAVLLAGPRAALLVMLALGVLALLYTLVRPSDTVTPDASGVAGYRGDGPLSAWIGGFVDGRLPPMAPLLVGLLVTCMLTALGLRNLPGILILTPAEAMLLAALGSSHLHAGPNDWRVPPLLQAGEYIFLAAAGYAGGVPAPVTFGLIAAVALRHLDMAWRARNRVPLSWFMGERWVRLPRADWRGFGWEGRMILAGIALMGGVTPLLYMALAAYLAALGAADFLAGWTNASLAGAPRYPSAPRRGAASTRRAAL
jgi:predicted outer membrane lipoprotein